MYGGCVNIFFHSTTPNGSLRRSPFHISCLRRLNFRHSIKICRTVCEVWPHSHRSSSTIFRLYKNERRPIFPVLISTSKGLCGFFSLVWIFKPFRSGCGTKTRRPFPLNLVVPRRLPALVNLLAMGCSTCCLDPPSFG